MADLFATYGTEGSSREYTVVLSEKHMHGMIDTLVRRVQDLEEERGRLMTDDGKSQKTALIDQIIGILRELGEQDEALKVYANEAYGRPRVKKGKKGKGPQVTAANPAAEATVEQARTGKPSGEKAPSPKGK